MDVIFLFEGGKYMTNKELADLIYPNVTMTIDDLEKKYPERNLKEGAVVSRFAPSPTGFVHMGSLLASFIESKVPEETDGVFYLRIEDTDQKRSVENGIQGIIDDLKNFEIEIDEGVVSETEQKGAYGPYIQSERKEIYEVYAKYLIAEGLAYPCFCSEEELNEIREIQEHKNAIWSQSYILAFCFSPAPLPRYFERASLNFQVRSSTKVRRAGVCVVSSR